MPRYMREKAKFLYQMQFVGLYPYLYSSQRILIRELSILAVITYVVKSTSLPTVREDITTFKFRSLIRVLAVNR